MCVCLCVCVCVCVCICVCHATEKKVFTVWKGEELVVRIESLQNYNFACCFVWVRNLVVHVKGLT